ncbi:MAG TPA: sulfatase [Thermomicrobiales bacterium]
MGQSLTDRRPHVVLITCHDLGRFLGCYGVATVSTPHLDALAADGVRLEQAFCVAPQCSPSRSALATGRYPHANGVMGLAHDAFGWDLHPRERHIAQILGEHGYETHLFGLQHVSTRTERLGFHQVHRRALSPEVAEDVEAVLSGARPEQPFYLEINLEEPHRPYDQGGVQPDASRGVTVPPYLPDTDAAREEFAALQGAVRQADQSVGRVLAALEKAGLSRQTLVLYTTDHGLAMPRAKCTLYDAGLEVAAIFRWPEGGIAGGRTVGALISNVDFLPTLLDACGIAAPGNLHGRSFLPLLRGEAGEHRDAIFAEKTFHSYYDPMRAIRTRRYKLIRNFETSFLVEVPGDIQPGPIYRTELQRYVLATHPDLELYDLERDPLEEHNLAGDQEYAAIQAELDARLWQWMEETGDPLLEGPVVSPAYRRAMAARRR